MQHLRSWVAFSLQRWFSICRERWSLWLQQNQGGNFRGGSRSPNGPVTAPSPLRDLPSLGSSLPLIGSGSEAGFPPLPPPAPSHTIPAHPRRAPATGRERRGSCCCFSPWLGEAQPPGREELQPQRARGQPAVVCRCCTENIPSVYRVCMERKMGEAVARVARKVNETVENKADFLDLADCKLMTFPIALYKVMRHVSEGIHLITLANNELKAVTSKFIVTFSQLRELNLEGNYLHRLPEEVRTLSHLRVINLSRNKFQHFPEQLTSLQALETINLEENEIAAPSIPAQ